MRLFTLALSSFLIVISGSLLTTTISAQPVEAAVSYSPVDVLSFAREVTVQVDVDGDAGGSGVLISREGDLYTVLTANHVVAETDRKYTIKIGKDSPQIAFKVHRLQSQARNLDLALVQFKSSKVYSVATLAKLPKEATSYPIFVYGFPSFNDQTLRSPEFSPGNITSFNASRPQGYAVHYSAGTWKGMSGGPVFDMAGRVIAIHGQGGDTNIGVVSSRRRGVEEENLMKTGFNSAIPVDFFLEKLPVDILVNSSLKIDDSMIEDIKTIKTTSYTTGVAQYDQGDFKGALQSFHLELKENPGNADAYFQRGVLLHEMDDLRAATLDYTQAIRINPMHVNARYNRALIRSKVGDLGGAIEDYSKVLKQNSSLASAYNNRGRLLGGIGQYQLAIEDFNSALKLEPKRANTYVNRGLIRYRLKDIKGAIADYTVAISLQPDYAKAYGNRGSAYAQIKDRDAAIRDFQEAANLFMDQGLLDDYDMALMNLQRAKQNL
jgi:serine protease Do